MTRIDSSFDSSGFSEDQLRQATDIFRKLVRGYYGIKLPILYADLQGAEDLLQVYTRLNMEGVPVSKDDVFFAAVKASAWPEAEEYLTQVQKEVLQNLNRKKDHSFALPFVWRVWIYLRGKRDLYPPAPRRLEGTQGRELIAEVKRILAKDSPQMSKWQRWANILTRRPHLGRALGSVNQFAWDPVLLWVAKTDTKFDREYKPGKEVTFLLATSALRYYTRLRDAFIKLAFENVYQQGASRSFPEDVVLEACRENLSGHFGSKSIPDCASEESKHAVANDNREMFLSIAQDIPFDLEESLLDWDHLFAQDKKSLMHEIEAKSGHKHGYHSKSNLVWKVGNLAGVPANLNREIRAELPEKKLAHYQRSESKWFIGRDRSLLERLFMTEEERDFLLKAEKVLAANPTSNAEIDKGMAFFEQYVQGRTKRIWEATEDRYRLSAYAR